MLWRAPLQRGIVAVLGRSERERSTHVSTLMGTRGVLAGYSNGSSRGTPDLPIGRERERGFPGEETGVLT